LTGAETPASVEALAAKAGASRVRVIVRLKEPQGLALGAEPSEVAVKAHAVAVRALEESLVTDIFGVPSQTLEQQKRGLRMLTLSPMIALSASADEIRRLAADPRVEGVTEDRLMKPDLLQSLGIIKMTGAGNAYAKGATGSGRAVAILDTGVNKSHEFISGKVVAEACYNTIDPANDSASRCPGGVASSTATDSGVDCLSTVAEGCGHGSHVAGIAAGKNTSHSAGEPDNGVAKSAKIVAINVFSLFSTEASCGTGNAPCLMSWESDQMAALQQVLALRQGGLKIDAANMSLGGATDTDGACNTDPLKPFIDTLRSANIATVIAAGNESYVNAASHPGCISTAITVAASSKRKTGKPERVALYSNLGTVVDTLAPGGDFNYPYVANKDLILSSYDNGYAFLAGTSMAAPHVTGAFAAIHSRKACRNKTVSQIETALHKTGLKIKDWRPDYYSIPVTPITKRRIDVVAVMKYLGCAP
jgi:serine protease